MATEYPVEQLEREVLFAIAYDPDLAKRDILPLLTPADFWVRQHAAIYQAMVEQSQREGLVLRTALIFELPDELTDTYAEIIQSNPWTTPWKGGALARTLRNVAAQGRGERPRSGKTTGLDA